MEIYSEKIYNNKKRIRVLGITIYKKEDKNGFITRKYLGGILKTKRNYRYYKIYFLGIQIYKRTFSVDLWELKNQIDNIENIANRINNIENNIIKRQSIINQRLITAAITNSKAFSKWKGAFRGKSVVLVGAGPTVNYFEPIKDAIYVGCNRAFKFDKVNFDFLFSIDKASIDRWYDEFFEYRKDKCIKFIGDQNLGKDFQISENKIPLNDKTFRYLTYAGIENISRFNLDIATTPLHNAATVSLQAMQFILYTQPEKVYIVGIDCTTASKQYFQSDGNEYNNSNRCENVTQLDKINIKLYNDLKTFAETYYPDTEIISINPVGLKGIFKDIYTEEYTKDQLVILQKNK